MEPIFVVDHSNLEQYFRTDLNVIEKAKLAKRSRLFVNGWCLRDDLTRVINENSYCHVPDIELFYDGDKAVGICALIDGTIQMYIKKSYRRKGIGSILAKRVIERNQAIGKPYYGEGIRGSMEFWNKTFQKTRYSV